MTNVSGRARFAGALTEALLIISKNDDPVFFLPPTHVNVSEGSYANVTIERGGDGTSAVVVTYSTEDETAKSSDQDYQPKVYQQVTIDPGMFKKEISIWVTNDSIPEGVERFTIRLINASGDTVLFGDTVAKVVIFANDGGTGVFQFDSNYLNMTGKEGFPVSFR